MWAGFSPSAKARRMAARSTTRASDLRERVSRVSSARSSAVISRRRSGFQTRRGMRRFLPKMKCQIVYGYLADAPLNFQPNCVIIHERDVFAIGLCFSWCSALESVLGGPGRNGCCLARHIPIRARIEHRLPSPLSAQPNRRSRLCPSAGRHPLAADPSPAAALSQGCRHA